MHGVDIAGASALLTSLAALFGTELYGVFSGKKNAATVTKEWHFADAWLQSHSPVADYIFRIFTIGFLVWTMLHLVAGVR